MSKTTKRRIAFVLVLVLLVSVALCGCKSDEEKLIGQWKKIEGSGFTRLEFFSDGTYDSNHANYSGNYSVTGNRLKLSGILASPKTYTFEFDGDTLILDGSMTYERVD